MVPFSWPSCAKSDTPTPADDDGLSGDVGGFVEGQEEGHVGNLPALPDPVKRNIGHNAVKDILGNGFDNVRFHHARSDGIDVGVEPGKFQRQGPS